MHEINVFITDNKISVDRDRVAVRAGDPIVWHFHNRHKDRVKWAQIEFDVAEPFQRRSADPPDAAKKRGTDVAKGHGCIMGTAPRLAETGTEFYKYHVRGLDLDPRNNHAATDKVPKLDPEIIIDDP